MTWRDRLRDPAWRDPLVVTVSALMALFVIVIGAPPVIRAPFTMWFLLTGPGLALVPLLRLNALRWVGVIAGSLVANVVITELMLYTGTWSLTMGMILILVVCAVGVVLQARHLLAAELTMPDEASPGSRAKTTTDVGREPERDTGTEPTDALKATTDAQTKDAKRSEAVARVEARRQTTEENPSAGTERATTTMPAAVGDDLQKINGIGPKLEEELKGMGITSYLQIARLTAEDIEHLTAALRITPGRIRRNAWMSSAADEHSKKYGETL
jgi:predicted flap endonuclease-1-like 5' DNA nuclease